MSTLHRDATIVDGLIISNWSRAIFEEMHGAGYTAASCTCCVWENFSDTMHNVSKFKFWLDEHADILRPVHTTADIAAAKAENRVGIILSWQNTSAIEDQLDRLVLFRDLGVRIVQLTYNTQNLVGSGCWETTDSGLSDFGHDAVAEMNRLGILIDLSHVGHKTSHETILASKSPVVYSHVNPAALRADRRNRDDEELRLIVERGGLVGATPFPWLLAGGSNATIEHYIDALDHLVKVCGEDHVGVSTDFGQGYGPEFTEWLMRDKGYGTVVGGLTTTTFESVKMPAGIQRIADVPNITEALERRGWPESRIRKVMGENWVRTMREVWGA
jgi:membrane dipeptidase